MPSAQLLPRRSFVLPRGLTSALVALLTAVTPACEDLPPSSAPLEGPRPTTLDPVDRCAQDEARCRSLCLKRNDAEGCDALGTATIASYGGAIPNGALIALPYYERACRGGLATGCEHLRSAVGRICLEGDKQLCRERALPLLLDGCAPPARTPWSCPANRSLAETLSASLCKASPGYCAEAAEPFARICKGRPSPNACREYAALAALTCEHPPRDPRTDEVVRDSSCATAAEPLFEACKRGSKEDCARADQVVLTEAALVCVDAGPCVRACDVGDVGACMRIGILEHTDRAHVARGTHAYERACEASRGARGCEELARAYGPKCDRGATDCATAPRVLPRDPEKEAKYAVLACQANVESACARLVRIMNAAGRTTPTPVVKEVLRLCRAANAPPTCAALEAMGKAPAFRP